MTKRKMYVVCLPVLVAISVAAFFIYQRVQADRGAQTTSKAPTAQSDYSDGEERSSSQGSTQGTGVDTNGEDVKDLPGEGVTSESGVITVLAPESEGLMRSGATLAGKAINITKVQYRVIDEVNGVVAQGSLSVIDDAFSGSIYFNAQSKNGRLDIFNFDSTGNEVNSIEMPIRFKE